MPVIASGIQGSPTTPTWVAVSVTAVVPPTASIINVTAFASSNLMAVAPNPNYGSVSSATLPPPIGEGNAGTANANKNADIFLESANIYYAAASSAQALVACGWEDNL